MATLSFLLWPSSFEGFSTPEPLFAFATALVVWIMTEFKTSEEFVKQELSKNDLKLARELRMYCADQFRYIFREHDFHQGISPKYIREVRYYIDAYDRGRLIFQNSDIQNEFVELMNLLTAFSSKLAQYSTPETFGPLILISIVPASQTDDFALSDRHKSEIQEINSCATNVWHKLEGMLDMFQNKFPEILDEQVDTTWRVDNRGFN